MVFGRVCWHRRPFHRPLLGISGLSTRENGVGVRWIPEEIGEENGIGISSGLGCRFQQQPYHPASEPDNLGKQIPLEIIRCKRSSHRNQGEVCKPPDQRLWSQYGLQPDEPEIAPFQDPVQKYQLL